jgi:hypothetical protein
MDEFSRGIQNDDAHSCSRTHAVDGVRGCAAGLAASFVPQRMQVPVITKGLSFD